MFQLLMIFLLWHQVPNQCSLNRQTDRFSAQADVYFLKEAFPKDIANMDVYIQQPDF